MPNDEPFQSLFTQGMVQRRVRTTLESVSPDIVRFPEELRRKVDLPAEAQEIEHARAALRQHGYSLEQEGESWVAVSGAVTRSRSVSRSARNSGRSSGSRKRPSH